MKYFIAFLLMCSSTALFAQEIKPEVPKVKGKGKVATTSTSTTIHGYVVDQMCAKSMAKKSNPMELAAKHTKECALEEACAASGFGLFYENGKWVKFDEKGDKLALVMIEKSTKERDFMADVTGEVKEGKMAVASLVESKMNPDEMKKPARKEAVHDHDHK